MQRQTIAFGLRSGRRACAARFGTARLALDMRKRVQLRGVLSEQDRDGNEGEAKQAAHGKPSVP